MSEVLGTLAQYSDPFLELGVQKLQQDRLAGVEIAQYVRLGQADAAAELVQADGCRRHLGKHRRGGRQDCLSPLIALLLGACSVKDHALIVQIRAFP